LQLAADVTSAIVTAAAQPTAAVAARLGKLAQDADALGLASVAVECTVARADALLKTGDRTTARKEAERAIARAETLGFRMSAAKAHYVRAEVLRATGDAEAKREYALVVRLLNDLGREEGNDGVLKRADLAATYAAATSQSGGAGGRGMF
jgi:ATP/maltotriose-dependent transcriptional regulator MalT